MEFIGCEKWKSFSKLWNQISLTLSCVKAVALILQQGSYLKKISARPFEVYNKKTTIENIFWKAGQFLFKIFSVFSFWWFLVEKIKITFKKWVFKKTINRKLSNIWFCCYYHLPANRVKSYIFRCANILPCDCIIVCLSPLSPPAVLKPNSWDLSHRLHI